MELLKYYPNVSTFISSIPTPTPSLQNKNQSNNPFKPTKETTKFSHEKEKFMDGYKIRQIIQSAFD